jgi:hypothetical protein
LAISIMRVVSAMFSVSGAKTKFFKIYFPFARAG